jgi:hypothetical protein
MASHPNATINFCLLFEWAATNYSDVTYSEAKGGVRHMVDFVCAHADTFNLRWSLERALAEEHKWHAELGLAQTVERTGLPLDTEIDYAPLPPAWECGGLSFVALQTGKALHAEGVAMHHCVATYWQRVVDGDVRIYSVRENGNRVATLELTGPKKYAWRVRHFELRQLVGACNSRTTPEVSKAARLFVEEIRSRVSPSPICTHKENEEG